MFLLGKDLRSRVLQTLLLLSLIPLLVVATLNYYYARTAVLDLVRLQLNSVAETRAAMLSYWLTQRMENIQTFAQLPTVVEAVSTAEVAHAGTSAQALAGVLHILQESSPAYDNLTVYDKEWRLLSSASGGKHPLDEFLTEEFKAELERASVTYIDLVHLHDAGDIGAHIGHPVVDPENNCIGYIVANLNLSDGFIPLLQSASGLWQTGKTYLISDDLIILTPPRPGLENLTFKTRVPEAIRKCIGHPGGGICEYDDFRGVPVLASAVTLPYQGWVVVGETDRAEALAWLQALLYRSLFAVAITLGAVLLVSTRMARLLGRPLRELAAVAQRIRSGNTQERLGPMNLPEADEVRRSFNQMLDELHEQQEQLIRSRTLATVGQLTTSVVHELRSPLSSIKMNLEGIAEDLEPGSPAFKLAQIASGQSQRVERLLHELLLFGKPLSLRRVSVAFSELSDEALGMTGDWTDRKSARVSITDEVSPQTVFGDQDHLSRALANLLLNAFHAIPVGGTIHLSGRLHPSQPALAEIAVSDTGPGLSPSALNKLFWPFFTTKPEGTGLGLVNAKKIIELHGGTIRAGNRTGGGALFVFTLPISEQHSNPRD